MRNYRLYISDILDCIIKINDFIGDMDFDAFLKNELVSSAVILKIIIIGEASKNVPEEIKIKYPEPPWKDMAAIRDKIAHCYFGIDFDIVWEVIKGQLPIIEPQMERILEDLDKQIN